MAVAAIPAVIMMAGMAASTMANMKAADVNAKGMQIQARNVEENAAYDETQQRRLSKFAMGEANATVSASGLDLHSGSPLLMELDRAKQSEMQALSVRRGGKMQADSLRYGADALKESKKYMIFGGAAQGGSILSQYVSAQNYTRGTAR